MHNALASSLQIATNVAEGWFDSKEFVAKRGSNLISGMFTVARLSNTQFASVRLCLYWLGYFSLLSGMRLGRINMEKRYHIITDIFLFLSTLPRSPGVPLQQHLQVKTFTLVALAATELALVDFNLKYPSGSFGNGLATASKSDMEQTSNKCNVVSVQPDSCLVSHRVSSSGSKANHPCC